jgi:hypothetical protein
MSTFETRLAIQTRLRAFIERHTGNNPARIALLDDVSDLAGLAPEGTCGPAMEEACRAGMQAVLDLFADIQTRDATNARLQDTLGASAFQPNHILAKAGLLRPSGTR